MKDTVGRERKLEEDGLDRLVKVTEENPANGNLEWETNYSYDVQDNLTQIDQNGQRRRLTYDAKSRLRSETTPEAGTTTYDYTNFDALSKRTDARGVVTTYTYGALNLLTGVNYNTANAPGVAATAAVSFNYRSASPGKGQIATMTDGMGGATYSYDSFGRLQSCIRAIDGINYPKGYEYNAAGQMTLMIYPSGKRVKMGHDARGRLAAIGRVDNFGVTQEPYLSEINYRADGQINSQKFGNDATESFGYSNDLLQLTSQTVTKGSNTLLSLSYGYEAGAGQMGSGSTSGNTGQFVTVTGTINGQSRNQEFTYDNVGRLVTATGWGAWERRFGYDRHGNRTAVLDSRSGGSQLQNTVMEQVGGIKTNRIESVNGTAFSYDASGNVTGDGASTYIYDAKNRIVSVSGLSSESYSYDESNRRLKKEAGGVVTHIIREGDKVIAEYEYGGGATQATGTRYYHQDRLSPRVITDNVGAVVGTMDHLPFGESTGGSGESGKYNFTTYEQDNTGLHYAVNRFYSSQQGRFKQSDPMGIEASSLADPQSLNLYSYVENDPGNRVDPTGTMSIIDPGITRSILAMLTGKRESVTITASVNFGQIGFGGTTIGMPLQARQNRGGGGGGGGVPKQPKPPKRSKPRKPPTPPTPPVPDPEAAKKKEKCMKCVADQKEICATGGITGTGASIVAGIFSVAYCTIVKRFTLGMGCSMLTGVGVGFGIGASNNTQRQCNLKVYSECTSITGLNCLIYDPNFI